MENFPEEKTYKSHRKNSIVTLANNRQNLPCYWRRTGRQSESDEGIATELLEQDRRNENAELH